MHHQVCLFLCDGCALCKLFKLNQGGWISLGGGGGGGDFAAGGGEGARTAAVPLAVAALMLCRVGCHRLPLKDRMASCRPRSGL